MRLGTICLIRDNLHWNTPDRMMAMPPTCAHAISPAMASFYPISIHERFYCATSRFSSFAFFTA